MTSKAIEGTTTYYLDVAALPPRPLPSSPAPISLLEALENAPFDDEPYTDEQRAADDEAREDVKRGHVVTTAELRQRLDEYERALRSLTKAEIEILLGSDGYEKEDLQELFK